VSSIGKGDGFVAGNGIRLGITIDRKVLADIDRLVRNGTCTSRSQVFAVAIKECLARLNRSRLARESAKLDKAEEQAFAEESYVGDVAAPDY
jgi:Arc/MetJ-type ribon-helix-helix transcriptional regulator